MAKLGDIATYINGYAFKPQDWSDEGIPIIRIQDLTGNSYQANRYNGEYASKYEVNDGDVLISWSASLGVYIWHGEKAVLNQHIFKVVFDKERISKDFFVHQVGLILENAASDAHGATMKHLTKPVFDALPFYLPPYEKQCEIAEVLDKVTSLISLRKQQLAKLDELVKARFVEMFGDSVANTKNFPSTTLETVMTVFPQNGLYKPQTDYVQDDTGIPILRIDAFYNGKVTNWNTLKRLICSETEIDRYLLKENDIVINRVNSIEYLGKCAHIVGLKEKTVFESNMMRFHMDEKKVNAVYVTEVLCTEDIYRQILRRAKKSVNQASINQEDVKSLEILVPPLSLQNQFAAFVERVDQQKQTVQQSLDKLELMKKALMQEYFG